ncbi:MAG: NYN domain-containing protein [Candidatus Pacebacteria bacterium]|nr:NYN domain-containing protein [Candidatus Paceibacterota bacterium]
MGLIKHKNQRVAVLIDVQNMYHSAKALYKQKVNFKEVLKTAVGGRQLIRAISYVIRTESGEEKSFFDALEKIGIELKIKDLQIFHGGMKKADWDVGLTVDAIRLADSAIDAIVLITGDGDFVPLVEYLKGKGKQVEIIAFAKSTSSRLRESTDDFLDLGESPKKYLI